MSELILYQTDDGKAQVKLRAEDGSAWLSQAEIAELFATTKQNVSLHIKNVLAEGELAPAATVKESLTVQTEGPRHVQRKIQLYRLEMILAVGYRVKGVRGTQFRQWATTYLSEYLVKGFVMDDERLKNPGGWDYFDELLARIREIRASEKRFYQKVRHLFALVTDYRIDDGVKSCPNNITSDSHIAIPILAPLNLLVGPEIFSLPLPAAGLAARNARC